MLDKKLLKKIKGDLKKKLELNIGKIDCLLKEVLNVDSFELSIEYNNHTGYFVWIESLSFFKKIDLEAIDKADTIADSLGVLEEDLQGFINSVKESYIVGNFNRFILNCKDRKKAKVFNLESLPNNEQELIEKAFIELNKLVFALLDTNNNGE